MRPPVLVGVLVAAIAALVVVLVLLSGPDLPPDPARDDERSADSPAEERPGEIAPPGETPEPTREPSGESPAEESRDSTKPAYRVRGVVLDDRGDPIPGARVIHTGLYPLSGLDAWIRTGEDGRFDLAPPAGAPRRLLLVADGHEPAEVDVPEGPRPEIEVRLRRLLRILVTVVDDGTGERVSEGRLLLRTLLATGEPSTKAFAYEMKDGRAVLADLEAGRYQLAVSVPGYDAFTSDEIRLTRDEPDATVEARVARSGPWGAVQVEIVDDAGAPVTRVYRVVLHEPESGFVALTPLGAPAPVKLEAPAGRHVLSVRVDGFLPDIRAVDVPEGSTAEVRVTLRSAGHIAIEVRDADDRPVTGYRLRVFDADGEELEYDLRLEGDRPPPPGEPGSEPASDDEEPTPGTIGKNQVIPSGDLELKNLPPGRYRIVAEKTGFNPAEDSADVEEGGTAKVKLVLR